MLCDGYVWAIQKQGQRAIVSNVKKKLSSNPCFPDSITQIHRNQVSHFNQAGISGGGSNAPFDCLNERTRLANAL